MNIEKLSAWQRKKIIGEAEFDIKTREAELLVCVRGLDKNLLNSQILIRRAIIARLS